MTARHYTIHQQPYMPISDAYFILGNFGYREQDDEKYTLQLTRENLLYGQFVQNHYDTGRGVLNTPLQELVKIVGSGKNCDEHGLCEMAEPHAALMERAIRHGFVIDGDQPSVLSPGIKNGVDYSFGVYLGRQVEDFMLENILDLTRRKVTGKRNPGFVRGVMDGFDYLYCAMRGIRREQYKI